MKLSGRLGLILQMLPKGQCLLDVGTDHALVPAAAVLDGRFERAIATDIRPGPLERAMRTVRRYALEDRMTLRLGAGLSPVAPGECDVMVLAGMGALMITEILESHPQVARAANLLVLQPMHAQERLRPWLRANGYEVLQERLAQEGDKRYQVLGVRFAGAVVDPEAQPSEEFAKTGVGSQQFHSQEFREADGQRLSPVMMALYDRVGRGILQAGGPIAVRWVADWQERQARIAEGLRRSGQDAAACEADSLLQALNDCLMALKARMPDGEEST